MDRRVRKTRAQLLKAAIPIAQEPGWDAVSIQQICDRADVARSTFYLHFRSKEELFDYGFSALSAELRNLSKERSIDADGTLGFLPALLRMLASHDHGFLFQISGGRAMNHLASHRIKAVIRDMISEEIRGSQRGASTTDGVVEFVAAGVFATLENWHATGQNRTVEDLLKETDQIISRLLQTG